MPASSALNFQPIPRYLSQPEVAAFFATVSDLRDRTVFALVYLYGLRVSEVSLLTRGDVDLERRRITVKRVKRGFWSERPLFAAAADLLAGYLALLYLLPDAPLFAGRSGPLQKRQIQTLFNRYRNDAGLPPSVTAHCLRHSIATHLLDAGMPLAFVQEHLGHRSSLSTAIYARISDRNRERLFAALDTSPDIVHPAAASSPEANTVTLGIRREPREPSLHQPRPFDASRLLRR